MHKGLKKGSWDSVTKMIFARSQGFPKVVNNLLQNTIFNSNSELTDYLGVVNFVAVTTFVDTKQ